MGPVPGNFCQKAESRRLSANLSKKDKLEPETNDTNERNASTFYPTYPRKLEEILQANWVKRSCFSCTPTWKRFSVSSARKTHKSPSFCVASEVFHKFMVAPRGFPVQWPPQPVVHPSDFA